MMPLYRATKLCSVCFHNGPPTRSGLTGLRCVLVGGLKLTAFGGLVTLRSPQRCWMGSAINGGHYVPHQQQNNSARGPAFLLLLRPWIAHPSASFSCSPAEKQENRLFRNGAHTQDCIVLFSAPSGCWWWKKGLAEMKLIKHVSQEAVLIKLSDANQCHSTAGRHDSHPVRSSLKEEPPPESVTCFRPK